MHIFVDNNKQFVQMSNKFKKILNNSYIKLFYRQILLT